MSSKEKDVKVCPHCRSTDVEADFSQPAAVATGVFHQKVKCNHCGFMGVPLLMYESDVPDEPLPVDDLAGDRKQIDTEYGKGVTLGLWKVSGPLLLFFTILFLIMQDYFAAFGVTLPGGILITLWAFKHKYAKENDLLRRLLIIYIFYIILGLPMLFTLLHHFGY